MMQQTLPPAGDNVARQGLNYALGSAPNSSVISHYVYVPRHRDTTAVAAVRIPKRHIASSRPTAPPSLIALITREVR